MKTIGFYEWFMNDVDFAIAVRLSRTKHGMTQEDVAKALGYQSGSTVSAIEVAKPSSLTIYSYLALCNLLDLDPTQYFDMRKIGQRHEQ